ncbi:DUF3793 family protein [Acetivibrio ethanolgignens]|uniref:DUF3793 domain-containing protein n=1 Tax=Acetivibrio ethanolgignens TaxID=290052 RepID=A0A0V8QA80_9FIRM|nr:DUF3793 family protein [Acetivibrio ethanolgignens]KSV57480.1 hypothetical protein ASU35_04695 [Acetivibrio ethanolgignens]
MSRELLAIVETMNQKSLEVQLALQCAPVLTGIKTANLLIIDKNSAMNFPGVLVGEGLFYRLLYEVRDKLVYLIYDRNKLLAYMENPEVFRVLQMLGYQRVKLEEILEEISRRYESYMKNERSFPHELGLLLGYPVEDVIGFIVHQGQNFLYKGYWKVYENPEQAKQLFEAFDRATERAVITIYQGNSIKSIVNAV